eukprot:GEMP01004379.1.p1 GENE.GEMP01004379.1~~GEMP01004379.1.p1  ORF type:complete len:625 (+),score=107.68 GEMP01004379.1:2304-4178(+)
MASFNGCCKWRKGHYEINMAHRKLDDNGAKDWARWTITNLPERVVARRIDFSSNYLTDAGVRTIMAALYSKRIGCEQLQMYRNYMGSAGAHAIGAYLLKYPGACLEVHLSHNYIARDGAIQLLKHVACNPAYPTERPMWLRLEHNCIEDIDGLLTAAETKLLKLRHETVKTCTASKMVCEISDKSTPCGPRRCVHMEKGGPLVHLPYIRQQEKTRPPYWVELIAETSWDISEAAAEMTLGSASQKSSPSKLSRPSEDKISTTTASTLSPSSGKEKSLHTTGLSDDKASTIVASEDKVSTAASNYKVNEECVDSRLAEIGTAVKAEDCHIAASVSVYEAYDSHVAEIATVFEAEDSQIAESATIYKADRSDVAENSTIYKTDRSDVAGNSTMYVETNDTQIEESAPVFVEDEAHCIENEYWDACTNDEDAPPPPAPTLSKYVDFLRCNRLWVMSGARHRVVTVVQQDATFFRAFYRWPTGYEEIAFYLECRNEGIVYHDIRGYELLCLRTDGKTFCHFNHFNLEVVRGCVNVEGIYLFATYHQDIEHLAFDTCHRYGFGSKYIKGLSACIDEALSSNSQFSEYSIVPEINLVRVKQETTMIDHLTLYEKFEMLRQLLGITLPDHE